jgi:hypothetical protein
MLAKELSLHTIVATKSQSTEGKKGGDDLC